MSVIPTYENERVYNQLKGRKTSDWDAIVIGSGMAGMSAACSLSKYGKKVLVLEQHYLPGGYTHSFQRKGFEWDAGVHAIGEMEGKTQPFGLMNWLTEGQVKWTSLGADYDKFYWPDGVEIGFPNNKKVFIDRLKNMFPDQSEGIDAYFALCKKAAKECLPWFAMKTLPEWLDKSFFKVWNLKKRNWFGITTNQVLDELGIKGRLRSILTAQWGYYGNTPDQSSFAIHALTVQHFAYGAYYPVGGSKNFAASLLGQVKAAGGETLCQAKVEKLLVNNGKVEGVKLTTGEEFKAPIVISAAAARTTVQKFLPESYKNTPWVQEILKLKQSPSYICLNLGFEGDITKAGASATNWWFNTTWDMSIEGWDVEDKNSTAPILYVSFPSLKDPLHKNKEKHTGECVTFIPWKAVEKWSTSDFKNRAEDYEQFKKDMHDRLMKQLEHHMPEVMKYCVYSEISTPLTAQHFVAAIRGSIYGLEATPTRFGCKKLRTRTPIKGFYMTGVDTLTTGVVGAMTSGILAAATVEPRIYKKVLSPH